MAHPSLARMETFAFVAEARSFSLAAQRLGLSKGAVSKSISTLESDLGARLLQRSTRKVSLTEAGEVFLRSCRAVLEEAERAERAVRDLQDVPRGMLRVNAPTGFTSLWLAPALPALFQLHPQLSVDLVGDDHFVDVAHGGWDVVVRVGKLADSDLVARKLAPVRVLLVASPGYLARRGTPSRPEDLAEHDCILYSLSQPKDRWPLSNKKGKRMSVKVSGKICANSDGAVRGALLADGGIAALPTFAVLDDLRSGKLQVVLPGWDLSMTMHALMPPTHAASAKVRAFVDFLVSRFARESMWEP